MKKQTLITLLALSTISTFTYPTVANAATTPSILTQQSAVNQLIAVFGDVSSWPKGLDSFNPTTQSGFYWIDDKTNPYSPSQWVGLACVFPGDKPSQYASDLGMTISNPTGTVTAGQLAQWVVKWEVKARNVQMSWEPSQDPYTILSDFSIFYGTDIKGPSSIVNQSDMMDIRNNIVEVSRGWRQLAPNKVELLMPIVDAQYNFSGAFRSLVEIHDFSKADWSPVYAELIKTVDNQTYTAESNGTIVYQYMRGTGYTPGVSGLFVNQKSEAYSGYSFADELSLKAYKTDTPSLLAQAFNEPNTEVFDPKQHLENFVTQIAGFKVPAKGQTAFLSFTSIVNPVTAKVGLSVASGLSFEFLYGNGKIQDVVQNNTASENYPSEVLAYA